MYPFPLLGIRRSNTNINVVIPSSQSNSIRFQGPLTQQLLAHYGCDYTRMKIIQYIGGRKGGRDFTNAETF
jgi:hypothetical protein